MSIAAPKLEQRLIEEQSPPLPAERPPGQVASVAAVRGIGLDEMLGALAAELGLGRDLVLERAVLFYRKLAVRARRAGLGPEAFFREVMKTHEQRTIRAEIDELRTKIADLREALAAARPAGPAGPAPAMQAVAPPAAPVVERRRAGGMSMSPVELFRQAKAARAARGWGGRRGGVEVAADKNLSVSQDNIPNTNQTDEARGATILSITRPADAHRALSSVADAANEIAPPAAPFEPPPGFTPISATPSSDAKLDYAERRTRVPKITF